ncbi:hypothetical protein PG995_006609 [Apiospora arundinis]
MSAFQGSSPASAINLDDSDSEGDGAGKKRGGKSAGSRGGRSATPTPRGKSVTPRGKMAGSRGGKQAARPQTPDARPGGKKATPQGPATKLSGGPTRPDLKLGLLVCPKRDPYRHIRTLPPTNDGIVLPFDSGTVGAISTVHSLQADMQSWVEGASLDTALRTLWQQLLPPGLRQMVYVTNWEDDSFFQWQSRERTVEQLQKAYDDSMGKLSKRRDDGRIAQRQLHLVCRAAWSILTVNVNANHWVTVIIHMAGPPPAAGVVGNPHQYYDRVSRICVVEGLSPAAEGPDASPLGTPPGNLPIYMRVEAMLRQVGLAFPDHRDPPEPLWRREIWRPHQGDANSCGVRAYSNIKHFLARLASVWESQDDPSAPPFAVGDYPSSPNSNDGRFFGPLPGWFHYELERWEMLGANAGAVVRACRYEARVAVEVIQNAQLAMKLPNTPETHQAWPGPVKLAARAAGARPLMGSPPGLFGRGNIPPAMRPRGNNVTNFLFQRNTSGGSANQRSVSGASTNSSISVIDLTQDGGEIWNPPSSDGGSALNNDPFASRRAAPQAIIYDPAMLPSRVSSGSSTSSLPAKKKQKTGAGTSNPPPVAWGLRCSSGRMGRKCTSTRSASTSATRT